MTQYDSATPIVLYHDIIDSIVAALEAKDEYTANHSRRVSDMTEQTCIALSMTESTYDSIHIAAHVHDIGKIGIPDSILSKPGKLSKVEWAFIRNHPVIGANILKKSTALEPLVEIVLHHHERWNGKGYPSGLAAESIPLGSRIIAICDSIDAMLSQRVYKKAMSPDDSKEQIKKFSGEMYDPQIAECVLKNWDKIVTPIQFSYDVLAPVKNSRLSSICIIEADH